MPRGVRTTARKPAPIRKTPPCIEPSCPDPTGGLIRAGRVTPMRIKGRCSTCFQRRLRKVKKAKKRGLATPCQNPRCPNPTGGRALRRKGKSRKKPGRKQGYCLGCFDKLDGKRRREAAKLKADRKSWRARGRAKAAATMAASVRETEEWLKSLEA